MKPVIFYKSVLGSSAQYSKWISEEFSCPVYTYKQCNREVLEQHEMVIVTSGTYLGWMPLTQFLIDNWKHMKDKIVVVVAVGILSPENSLSTKSFETIPVEIRKNIKYFKLPGKIGFTGDVKNEYLKEVFEFVQRYL
jgi:hypothetical protein